MGDEPARVRDYESQRPPGETEHTGTRRRHSSRPRGREASAPHEIPLRGWTDVLWRVWRETDDDNLGLLAAGAGFFAILAMVPTLIAAISLYGLVVSPEQAEMHIQSLAGVLPPDARSVLLDQVHTLTERAPSSLGWSAVLGLLTALWSVSSGTSKLVLAIGLAYDEPDERSYLRRRVLAVVLTLGFLLMGGVALSIIAVPSALRHLQLSGWLHAMILHGRWVALGLLAMLGLSVLYAVAPDRRRARWQWVTWGAALATLLWLGASMAFSLYVEHMGKFGETSGALGGVIVLMLWSYLSAYTVLLGAELNAELEAQTAVDSTIGDARPMGQRQARKADTLGKLRD